MSLARSSPVLLSALALLGALAAPACVGEESVAPAEGLGSGGASSSAATGQDLPDPPAPPAKPVREVFQRDPFGNVKERENLLWDGDFEWQSAFADQYGWSEGFGFTLGNPVVGPTCRSGLKCARIPPNRSILGIGMSSAVADLYVSGWVKPDAGDCNTIDFVLLPDGIVNDAFEAPVPPTTVEPDGDGWCRYEVVAPQRDAKSFVYIGVPGTGSGAIADDIVLRRASDADGRRVARIGAWVPGAALAARLDAAREGIRRRRGPQEGRPDPLRAEMDRFGRGERRELRLARPGRTRP